MRKGAIVIDLYQVRAVFRNTDAIAYVDSGDESNDNDFAARVCRQSGSLKNSP